MYKRIFLLIGGILFCFAHAGENLVKNSDFENGIDDWYGMKLSSEDKPTKDNSILLWEKNDTFENSKGCLRVNLNKISSSEKWLSHNSGAVCKFNNSVPKDTIVKISFYAKSISGSKFLNVNRKWGGEHKTFEISDKWNKYEFETSFSYDTGEIVFNLVGKILGEKDIVYIEKGEFLIDNVSVEIIGEKKLTSEKQKPSICFIISKDAHDFFSSIDPTLVEIIEKDGFVQDILSWKNVTSETISKYDLVFIFTFGQSNPDYTLGEEIKKRINLVKKYVENGGNVWINVHIAADMRDYAPLMDFLKEIGANVLLYNISDPSKERILPPWHIKFSYTSNINKKFVNIENPILWYPVDLYKIGPRSFTFDFSDEWEKIIETEDTVELTPIFTRIAFFDEKQEKSSKRGKYPLMGIRKFGSGNIIVSGFYHPYVFSDPFAPALGKVMIENGFENKKSHWILIFRNILKDVCKEYEKIKRDRPLRTNPDLKKNPYSIPPYYFSPMGEPMGEFDWRYAEYPVQVWRKGAIFVINENFPLSKYTEEAKNAGLEFVVLIKELSKLDRNKISEFKNECKKLSDPKFSVIYGIFYKDIYGDNLIATGEHITFPDRAIWDEEKKCLKPPKPGEIPGALDQLGDTWSHFHLTQMHFSSVIASLLHNQNTIPYDDYRDYNAISIITTKNGEIIDEAIKEYLRLQDRGENLLPLSVHFIENPEEIGKIVKNNNYLIYLCRDPYDFFSHDHMLDNPSIYVSNGPKIKYYMWKGPRDYENKANPYDISRWYFILKIDVESAVGLSEIKIYDGLKVFRNFILNGEKTFSYELPLLHDKQKNLVLIAKDVNGKICVSAEAFDRNHIAEEFMCSDRNNQLFYSMQARKNGIPFSRGFSGSVTPFKGPWTGIYTAWMPLIPDPPHRLSVVGFDGIPYGSCEIQILGWGYPFVEYGEMKLRSNPDRILNSMDVAIGKSILNTGYLPTEKVTNVWHTILPVYSTKLIDAEIKNYYFIPRPDTDLPASLVDLKIKFKEDFQPKETSKLAFFSLLIDSRNSENYYLRVGNDFYSGVRKIPSFDEFFVPFNKGSYVKLGNGPTGSTIVFSLSDNLFLYADKNFWRGYIGIKNKGPIKKGEEFEFKFLIIGEPFNYPENNLICENIFKTFFSGQQNIILTKGKVIENSYPLVLKAENGIIEGKKKSDSYISIPLMIQNLNKNTSTFLYFPDTNKFRPVAVDENGIGYVSLPGKGEEKFIIGDIIEVDNKDVIVNVVITEKNEILCEIHNPLDKKIKTAIKNKKEFPFLKDFYKEIELKPGEGLLLKI